MVVQYFVGNPQPLGHFLRFFSAAFGEYSTSLLHMARITISDGKKLHLMAHFDKQCGRTTALDITVIWMGADHHDLQGPVLCLNQQAMEDQKESKDKFLHGDYGLLLLKEGEDIYFAITRQ